MVSVVKAAMGAAFVVLVSGVTACNSADSPARSRPGGEPQAGPDASVPGQSRDGCTENVMTASPVPSDGGSTGSPRESAEAAGGIWTNRDGDLLDIEPGLAAVLHLFSGNIINQGGLSAFQTCAEESYAVVNARLSIHMKDGRLDESTDLDLRFQAGPGTPAYSHPASLTGKIPLSAIHGTFKPMNSNNDGALELAGTFADGTGWDFYGSVTENTSFVGTGGGRGEAFGGAEVVNMAPFDQRISGPRTADGGAAQ